MTDDGALANQLTHPRYGKTKRYEVTLDKPLAPLHQQLLRDRGVMLEDGLSRFIITKQAAQNARHPAYQIHMTEGRNRQIRRTLAALGYTVTSLHRTHFGSYSLGSLAKGTYKNVA
jgi:23S rRNA pseudouridine2605 synthase